MATKAELRRALRELHGVDPDRYDQVVRLYYPEIADAWIGLTPDPQDLADAVEATELLLTGAPESQ